MGATGYMGMRVWLKAAILAACGGVCAGQTPVVPPANVPVPATIPAKSAGKAETAGAGAHPTAAPAVAGLALDKKAAPGTEIDRVAAVVNGELILESDVDEERRFAAFQPYRDQRTAFSRDKAMERLIDRALILQQAKLQQETPINDAAVKTELDKLRKDIPACKRYHCETDEGWKKFVEEQGFSLADLADRWRERMEVLRYIEERFRQGIRITDAEIRDYYQKTMMPEYAKEKVAPPQLDTLSDRIQEVLLQQRVSTLLQDWLKSLRAQGSVSIGSGSEVVQ